MSTILGTPASPYVRKVMLAHAFKDIDFQLNPVIPGSDDAEFVQASPLGKIPAYKTDSGALFSDSSVIIAYLEKTHPQDSLYPEEADDFAKALWLEEYADTKLSEVCNALYFQKVIGPLFFQHEPDEERIKEIIESLLPPVLSYIESHLSLAQWLINDEFSIADISVGSMLVGLQHAKYSIDKKSYPKVADFYKRFIQLDFVDAQIALEANELFAD